MHPRLVLSSTCFSWNRMHWKHYDGRVNSYSLNVTFNHSNQMHYASMQRYAFHTFVCYCTKMELSLLVLLFVTFFNIFIIILNVSNLTKSFKIFIKHFSVNYIS